MVFCPWSCGTLTGLPPSHLYLFLSWTCGSHPLQPNCLSWNSLQILALLNRVPFLLQLARAAQESCWMEALSQEVRDGNRGVCVWGGGWPGQRLSSRTWGQSGHLWRSWQDPRDGLSGNLNFGFPSWNEASLPYLILGCCQGRPWSLGPWGWDGRGRNYRWAELRCVHQEVHANVPQT